MTKYIMPKIVFKNNNPNLGTQLALYEYERIWQTDCERIVKVFYDLTGLRFWYKHITVFIVNSYISKAGNRYSRMKLTAYEYNFRAKNLTHELAHRLLHGNYMGATGRAHRFWDHYRIDLFLFDAWVRLYGKEQALKYVEYEKINNTPDAYKKAWLKTMTMTFDERQAKLKQLVARTPKKYIS